VGQFEVFGHPKKREIGFINATQMPKIVPMYMKSPAATALNWPDCGTRKLIVGRITCGRRSSLATTQMPISSETANSEAHTSKAFGFLTIVRLPNLQPPSRYHQS